MNSGFVSVIIAGLTPLIIMTALFAGIGYHAVSWQPPALWIDHLGPAVVYNIAAGSNGIYSGGGGGPAGSQLFLIRYDQGGQRLWSQDFGNGTIDWIQGIALGTDGVYIAGMQHYSSFIRKYNFNGNILWTKQGVGLEIAVSGGSLFVGSYDDSSRSNLLLDYDPNGNLLWTDSLGNKTGIDSLSTYSGDSRVYLLGSWNNLGSLRSYNFDGTLNWAENLTCSCTPTEAAVDASGIYVVGTSFQSLGLGGTLAKYDLVGKQIWVKNFDSPDGTTVGTPRISVDLSGIYLAITTSFSGYLIRYDSNGNQVWSVQVPRSANAVSVGQDGVYVGGGAPTNALLSKYGQSSSLVLFGVNPPLSFGLVALLGGIVALSLFWLRRQRKNRIRRPKSAGPYGPPKPGGDNSKWVRRPP